MAILKSIGPILAFHLFFLTLIVVGFIRFRKPESGQLIIPGFIGLAICVFFFTPSSFSLVRDGIISFDNYVNLMGGASKLYIISLPAGILFILFMLGIVKRDHKYSGEFMLNGGVGAFIAFIVVMIALPSWVHNPTMKADSEVKENIHTIMIALERYAVDSGGLYPERIESLVDDQYMAFFPGNPFIWQANEVPPVMSEIVENRINPPMKIVPYGSPDFEGNFTYLPVIIDDEVVGYYLIGYGYKKTTGDRLISPDVEDHVIIVVESTIRQPPESFPDVQDVILQSQSSD